MTLHPGVTPTPYHLIQAWSLRASTHRRRTQLVVVPVLAAALTLPAILTLPGVPGTVTAAALTATVGVSWAMWGLHPGWLWSVTGRPRWLYLGLLTGTALVVTAMMHLPYITPSGQPPTWLHLVLTAAWLVAAGGQEMVRGWFLQAVGRARTWPVTAVTVSAILTGLIYTTVTGWSVQSLVWFTFFGAAAGVLTVATGGIEAAVALHVAHATVVPVMLTTFGHTPRPWMNPATGGWEFVCTAISVTTLFAVFALWLHHTWRLTTRTTPGYRHAHQPQPDQARNRP